MSVAADEGRCHVELEVKGGINNKKVGAEASICVHVFDNLLLLCVLFGGWGRGCVTGRWWVKARCSVPRREKKKREMMDGGLAVNATGERST